SLQGTNPMGVYYVAVTDSNGCVVYSNEIYVTQGCNDDIPGVECDLPVGLDISAFSASWNCDQITASFVSNITPDNIYWEGGQHLDIIGVQNTPNVTFKTDVPGVHPIFVTLTYDDCEVTLTTTVKKYYEPKLNVGIICDIGSNSYGINLSNASVLFE